MCVGESDHLIGIISDIHGNQEALDTAMAYLDEEGISTVYCLGDLVGYGQAARYVVDTIRERNIPCIQGNHDGNLRPPRDPRMREAAVVALDIAMEQLEEDQVDWLMNLNIERRVDDAKMVLVHGALTGRDDYIINQEALVNNMKLLMTEYKDYRVCFFGHSHLNMIIGDGKVRTRFPETDVIDLDPAKQYLINVGSVGQPRDGNPLTSFGIYDPNRSRVHVIRLPYDIEKEQERMKAAGLPDKLWQRLAIGR